MIRMIRVSDGEPANADTEVQAEMLQLQGYRRVDPRTPTEPQPAPPADPAPAEPAPPADPAPADVTPPEPTGDPTEVDQGAAAHPADEQPASTETATETPAEPAEPELPVETEQPAEAPARRRRSS